MGEARDVADATRAREMTTRRWVQRVQPHERAGLLTVRDLWSRAGRPLGPYRAAASVNFVPFWLAPAEQVGRQNRQRHFELVEVAISRTLSRPPFDAHGWGFVTACPAKGDVYFQTMREDGVLWVGLGTDAPVMVSGWHLLRLRPDDARGLPAELRALHERFRVRTGEQPFLLGVFPADTSELPGSGYVPAAPRSGGPVGGAVLSHASVTRRRFSRQGAAESRIRPSSRPLPAIPTPPERL